MRDLSGVVGDALHILQHLSAQVQRGGKPGMSVHRSPPLSKGAVGLAKLGVLSFRCSDEFEAHEVGEQNGNRTCARNDPASTLSELRLG
jgi:hypothetical protein